jgi:hypothetical protein
MKILVGGTPTLVRVLISRSIARLESGGSITNASTFFRDLPALTTMSMLLSTHIIILHKSITIQVIKRQAAPVHRVLQSKTVIKK